MNDKYLVIAKFRSRYGLILYAAKVSSDEATDIDLDNVYIHTLYSKSSSDYSVGSVYSLSVIKGENGLKYCFPCN